MNHDPLGLLVYQSLAEIDQVQGKIYDDIGRKDELQRQMDGLETGLVGLGTGVIPFLVSELRKPQYMYFHYAKRILPRFGRDAVPYLHTLLDDKDPEIREAALGIAARLGRMASPLLPNVVPLLQDESWNVRSAAVSATAKTMPDEQWVGLVPRLLKDPKVCIRMDVVLHLADIPLQALAVINHIIGCLDDDDKDVREFAAKTLQTMGQLRVLGEHVKDVAPALIAALRHDDSDASRVWPAVFDALFVCGQHGVGTAIMALGSSDSKIRRGAAYLVRKYYEEAPKPSRVLPTLMGMLVAGPVEDCVVACRGLAAIGPQAKDAVPDLRKIGSLTRDERLATAVDDALQRIVGADRRLGIAKTARRSKNQGEGR